MTKLCCQGAGPHPEPQPFATARPPPGPSRDGPCRAEAVLRTAQEGGRLSARPVVRNSQRPLQPEQQDARPAPACLSAHTQPCTGPTAATQSHACHLPPDGIRGQTSCHHHKRPAAGGPRAAGLERGRSPGSAGPGGLLPRRPPRAPRQLLPWPRRPCSHGLMTTEGTKKRRSRAPALHCHPAAVCGCRHRGHQVVLGGCGQPSTCGHSRKSQES